MPIYVSEGGGGQHFEPAPPGLYRAVCVDVIDLGEQETKYGKKFQLKIIWQIDAKNAQGERYQIRQTYTQSLSEGSNLRRDLEAWRGRPFSRAELAKFDVETVIGANCQLQTGQRISQNTKKPYAFIQAIVRQAPGPMLKAENYTRDEPKPQQPPDAPADEPDDAGPEYFEAGDDDVPFSIVALIPLAGLMLRMLA